MDESTINDHNPVLLATRRAEAKAQAITVPNALVIGSDQVVALGSRIFGKPHTFAAACSQLAQLADQTHQLITAVSVFDTQNQHLLSDVDIHEISIKPLTQKQIHNYIQCDKPFDCAGSYKFEERGAALFRSVKADPELADSTAIMGLPLLKTIALLRRHHFEILDYSAEEHT